MFELSDELEEKEVVIDENVVDPSASKNSNYYALRDYLNDKYNISLAEHGFGDAQACCLYVLIAVGAVVAVLAYWVYAGVAMWGADQEQLAKEGRVAKNRKRELILEIAGLLN